VRESNEKPTTKKYKSCLKPSKQDGGIPQIVRIVCRIEHTSQGRRCQSGSPGFWIRGSWGGENVGIWTLRNHSGCHCDHLGHTRVVNRSAIRSIYVP